MNSNPTSGARTPAGDQAGGGPKPATGAGDVRCPGCGAVVAGEASEGLCTRCLLASAAVPTEGPAGNGGRIEMPALERVRAAFPRLEVAELIGAGGMGAVFKARQPDLDRHVALKVLPESLGRDPAFAERFLREARVLARLNHPNIVAVHDFGQADGLCYVLMEYVDGVNLRQAMKAGRFSAAQALGLIPQICAVLQFAHDAGVMHRDVKPENILLDARGQLKLADFGIAKLLDGSGADPGLTVTGSAVGTPQYMAPEQIEKPGAVDHRADIYSLGVVFYELLTGELPLGRFAPPSSKTPLDARVDEIVLRALAKERELRHQSASELGSAVERVGEAGRGSERRPVPRVLDNGSRGYRIAVLTVLALTTLLMIGSAIPSWRFMVSFLTEQLQGNGVEFLARWLGPVATGGLAFWAWRGREAWWAPFQRWGDPGDPLDRAVRRAMQAWVVVFAVGWFLSLSMALSAFGQAVFRGGHAGPGDAALVPWVLLLVAGIVFLRQWVVRSSRWPMLPPDRPVPHWVLRMALILAVVGLLAGAEGLRHHQRWDGTVSFTWGTVPLVSMALWTRSRCWRVLGLAGTGYVVVVTLGGIALLGSRPDRPEWQWVNQSAIEMGDPLPSVFWMMAGLFGNTLLHATGFWALCAPEVRRAFGFETRRRGVTGTEAVRANS